jgi:hypothetical protein
MSTSWRFAGVLVGLAALSAGCDKSGTTPSAGPGKAGDEAYSKKLVGLWEGTEPAKDGGKDETMTVEFKADNSLKIEMGPFELTGTWKVVKEEGKTLTVDTEVTLAGFPDAKGKPDKKTFTVVFQDANTIVMSKAEGKPDERTLKRKS